METSRLFFRLWFGVHRAIPFKRTAETLLEHHLRIVAQKLAGLSNVRLRIADVAFARRVVLYLELPA